MLQLALGILVGQIVLLLLLRPLVLWYFKLNRITKTLDSIDLSLSLLPAVREYRARILVPGRYMESAGKATRVG